MREPNSRLAQARERKEAFLPEIARLSLEGHTSREVAEKVGVPKTTVLRWRNSLRRECASRSVKETMEMIHKLNERYDTIYRKALEGLDRDVQRILCDNAFRNLFPDCRLSDRWVRTGSRVEARRTLNLFKDKLLYVDAILDHIVLDQLVRKTLLFCEQKKPDFVGIEAEQFQEMKDEG